MGVRLYNSATALFTSTDPVPGGNANDYTYPSDPINSFDIDGKRRYDEENETPRSTRFKSWLNSHYLYGRVFFPNYPYGRESHSAYTTPTHKAKTHKRWRSFRKWGMRRVRGGFKYGARGFLGGFAVGYNIGCVRGKLKRKSCVRAGGALGVKFGEWGMMYGQVYGVFKGSNNWW
jgi:hypothetical protein